MLSEDLMIQLRKENEQLRKELADLNYLIELREQELLEIKNATQSIAELKSNLERNLIEFEQMQQQIELNQRKVDGAERRTISIEDEMIESMKIEQSYYQIQSAYNSNKAALEILHESLNELSDLHKEIAALKSKNTSLESSLEIALLENGFLKEDLLKQTTKTE
jgi:predicted  nucleic acid-binding Zn-ribbon protein